MSDERQSTQAKPKFRIVKEHVQGAAAMLLVGALATTALMITPGVNLFGQMDEPENVDVIVAGTDMDLATRYTNFTVSDPKTNLLNLSTKTEKAFIKTPEQGYIASKNHIQGYAVHDRGDAGMFHIFSHEAQGTGFIYIAKGENGGAKIARFNVPEGYHHPAGMQIIGDYLFVAAEKSGGGAVLMYDLTPVYNDSKAPDGPVTLVTTTGGSSASSVGITNVSKWNGVDGLRYVMAVHNYDKRTVDLYVSAPEATLAKANSDTFTHVKTIKHDNNSYDNMALVSSPNNDVWMAGFRTSYSGSKAENQSYADIYQLVNGGSSNIAATINSVAQKKFETKQGSPVGLFGVHFRWGVGLNIYENNKLRLNVSERDFGDGQGGGVDVNFFFNQS